MNAEKLQHIHKVLNQSQCIYNNNIIVSINNWKMMSLVALALPAGYVNKQSVKIQNQIN